MEQAGEDARGEDEFIILKRTIGYDAGVGERVIGSLELIAR